MGCEGAHDWNNLRMCDYIVFLQEGRIYWTKADCV